MNGRERICRILRGRPVDRVAFWPGNPTPETKRLYARVLGIPCPQQQVPQEMPQEMQSGLFWEELAAASERNIRFEIELASTLGSDLFWCSPELNPSAWRPPEADLPNGGPIFDCYGGRERSSLGAPGVFAECEDVREVEAFDWPDPAHLDFSVSLHAIDWAHARGMAAIGGMWAPFFHVLCDFMGMENYFVKMLTNPEVVDALSERVVGFYLAANRRYFEITQGCLDAFFFGNDLGSQRDLLISPELFDRFVRPSIERLVAQAHSFGLPVMFHSCGSVAKIIPRLLETGIDALHPLQARAAGMDAESLAGLCRDKLALVGGVDTQDLLPFHPPSRVRAEVKRLRTVFGQRLVVSPSHEALLPNVPLENVLAMRDGALE